MPPGTPQHNGVSECHNRTLLHMVRSMMSLIGLPLSFWGYALETATFTFNRATSKSVETTPYELVGERSMQFQKNPTVTQDLSRRYIATRGESVSTYPRRSKTEAFA